MKIGFFQYAVFKGNRQDNFDYIMQVLENCQCDLLVLPELFTCGYSFNDRSEILPFAENLNDSQTVKFLKTIGNKIGGTVIGTIPEIDNGTLYNSAIAVSAEGVVGVQRKVHLTTYEKKFFNAGNEIITGTIPNGTKIGIMSCFDCWFPQFGSLLKQQGVQIFCNPASFGGEVTPMILPIRARENQVFVISCNRIGAEMFGNEMELFCGKSQIISPDGKVLANAESEEKLAVVDIDLDEINHPQFGSLLCKDFSAEHNKYNIIVV